MNNASNRPIPLHEFDATPFAIVTNLLGKEKVSFGVGSKKEHFTIHLGLKSGVLDVHKTIEGAVKKYETLFRISHSDLTIIWNKLEPFLLETFLSYVSDTINIGKLDRKNCILVPCHESSGEGILINKKEKKNSTKIKLRKFAKQEDLESIVKELDEFGECEDKVFFVYRFRRNRFTYQGILIKNPYKEGSRQPIWISKKKSNTIQKPFVVFLYKILSSSKFECDIDLKDYVAKIFLEKYNTSIEDFIEK